MTGMAVRVDFRRFFFVFLSILFSFLCQHTLLSSSTPSQYIISRVQLCNKCVFAVYGTAAAAGVHTPLDSIYGSSSSDTLIAVCFLSLSLSS